MGSRKISRKRIVRGLKSAKLLKEKPPFIPNNNVRGSRLAGLRYEKAVATRLKNYLGEDRVIHNPWIEYIDKKGKFWCSPDIIILPIEKQPLVIGECKLTYTPAAERKLKNIYSPTCQKIWPTPQVRLITIFSNLTQDFDDILIDSLDDIYGPEDWTFANWNWRLK